MTIVEHDSSLSEFADLLEEEDGRVLPGHRTRITLADGTTFVARITNREYIAWDKTAPRKKWGAAKDVPFLAATFMAWAAAKRDGLTALSFDVFCDQAEEVDNLPEEEEDLTRPTQRGAGADS